MISAASLVLKLANKPGRELNLGKKITFTASRTFQLKQKNQ